MFQQFGGGDVSGTLQDIDLIMDIPVKLTVELGRTRMTIKELLRLTQKDQSWRWTVWRANRWIF